jgi:RNA polymerase sigma-70 factor (ECF subfamily)
MAHAPTRMNHHTGRSARAAEQTAGPGTTTVLARADIPGGGRDTGDWAACHGDPGAAGMGRKRTVKELRGQRGLAGALRPVDRQAGAVNGNGRRDRSMPATGDRAATATSDGSGEFGTTSDAEADATAEQPPGGRPPRAYFRLAALGVDDTVREEFVQALYAEHTDFLMSFVLRLTGGDRQWAEDVLQETMLRAWRHAGQLLDGVQRSLLPWLTTVARRIVSNDRRSRRARPHEVDDVMLEAVMVEDETDRALQRMIILRALHGIGRVHREVVVELYLRGRTVEQVAAMLDVPRGTVKSRSYYAMRALRAALEKEGVSRTG